MAVQLENGRETELLLVRPQGAKLIAQPLGEHRDGAIHQIDGGGSIESLAIDQALGLDIMRHVSNVYAHFPMAIL